MRIFIALFISILLYNCTVSRSRNAYVKNGIVPKSEKDVVWQEYLVKVEENNKLKEIRKKELDSLKELKSKNDSISDDELLNCKDSGILPKYKLVKADGSEQILNLNEYVNQHIKKYFNYPEFALEYEIQGRVNVEFVIDKEGKIEKLFANGPKNGLILEQEATKIMSKFPVALEPASCSGKPVKIKFAIPIVFKIAM